MEIGEGESVCDVSQRRPQAKHSGGCPPTWERVHDWSENSHGRSPTIGEEDVSEMLSAVRTAAQDLLLV